MKKLKWIVLALVLALGAVILVVLANINGIVRTAVETQSTASLGLQTKLRGASVSLLGGKVGLSDFSVASPPGFAAPAMMQLGGLTVEAGLSELRQDPVRVSTIKISKPRLVLEQKDLKLNLKAALDQMPKANPSDPSKEPTRVAVSTIIVEEPTVVIMPGIPGLSQEITVPLPTLTIKELGTGPDAKNGVAIREAVMAVATEMASAATDSEKLPPEVRALLKGDLSNIKAQIGKQIDALKERVGEQVDAARDRLSGAATRATEEARDKLKEGLGDLLKPKK